MREIQLREALFPPDVTPDSVPRVQVIFEEGQGIGEIKEKSRRIEEISDLPFLLPVYEEVLELLKEATREHEECIKELEAFRKRFALNHLKKSSDGLPVTKMSALLEALLRGEPAIPEVAKALREFGEELRRVRELEGEIADLVRKVGLLDPQDPSGFPGPRRSPLPRSAGGGA